MQAWDESKPVLVNWTQCGSTSEPHIYYKFNVNNSLSFGEICELLELSNRSLKLCI